MMKLELIKVISHGANANEHNFIGNSAEIEESCDAIRCDAIRCDAIRCDGELDFNFDCIRCPL